MEQEGLDLSRSSCVVQGYRNVGYWAGRLLAWCGARLVAVEDVTGAIAEHVAHHWGVPSYTPLFDHERFFTT